MNFETRRSRRPRPHIEMIPMIDVTVFLLVFFMLFTTFKTTEAGIQVDLPKAATGTQQRPTNLVVTITQSGAIYLNERLITMSVFSDEAQKAVAADPDTRLTLRVDSRAYWEHAVRLMDAARQAGIHQLDFGTQPDED